LDNIKITLHKRDRTMVYNLYDIINPVYIEVYGGINTLDFSIPYTCPDFLTHEMIDNPAISLIKPFYLVKFNDEWFIIDKVDKISDDKSVLNIKTHSLGYELKNKNIRGFKTGIVDNPVKNLTDTMNLILVNTNWSVDHVDVSLDLLYRAIEISDKSVLDAIINDVCIKWDCVPKFSTETRKMSFVNYKTDGLDLGLYISENKYLKNIQFEMEEDSICTKLKIFGKNNISINQVNPSGQNYISDFSYFKQDGYMTSGLKTALENYETAISNNQTTFQNYVSQKTTLQTQLSDKEHELDVYITDSTLGLNAIQQAKDIAISNGQDINATQTTIENGILQSATLNTAVLSTNTLSDRDDYYNGCSITITSGAGVGQTKTITDYVASSKTIIVNSNWSTIPNNTSMYNITNSSILAEETRRQNVVNTIQDEVDYIALQISDIDDDISTLRNSIDISTYLTSDQLEELNDWTIEKVYTDTAITEQGDSLDVLQQLLTEAQKQLSLQNQPRFNATVDVVDFCQAVNVDISEKDRLKIGSIVMVRHSKLNIDLVCKIIEIERDYFNYKITIKIANEKSIKNGFTLIKDILKNVSTTSAFLSLNSDLWSNGGSANDLISGFLNNSMDATKQMITAGVNNEVQINNRGITIVDPTEPQYVQRFVCGSWGLSEDFGNSFSIGASKGVIHGEIISGKIYLKSKGKFSSVKYKI